jgi:hypothetical protein
MNLKRQHLESKNQTGDEMNRLIKTYSKDVNNIMVKRNNEVCPLSKLSLDEAFDYVKNIPYRQDTAPVEVVSRPAFIAKNSSVGMDCKKKAILLSAYLHNRGIPYRLIASSKKLSGRIHHVFPQVQLAGNWYNFDATYSNYKPFQLKTLTKAEIL